MDMGEFFLPGKEPSSLIIMSENTGRPYYVGTRPRVVELFVPMCCTKCEEKVRESMLEIEGVQRVVVDPTAQRVSVTGLVDPSRTLKKARRVKRDSQFLSGDRLVSTPVRVLTTPVSSTTKLLRNEYRPAGYQPSSSFVQPQPAIPTHQIIPQQTLHRTAYQTSLNSHTPSYGYDHMIRPSYDEMVITNPCYVKRIEPMEYWY